MSSSIHLMYNTIPGYGPSDGCLPCSGVSGGAASISPCTSRGDQKVISDVKFLSLKCASRARPFVCNASSQRYRRNPEFSKQNKNGFTRSWNRYNEERDGYENLEESEIISSKDGPLLSVSGNQKFQGRREREIVELFRKVLARLRERTAVKEEKKMEDSQEKSKENTTVDSLLKLLRKHSVQLGEKNSNSASSRDFVLNQSEQIGQFAEDRSTSILDSNNNVKPEMQESQRPHVSRPASNFHKRSPVSGVKFQPIYSDEGSINPVSRGNLDGKSRLIESNAEPDVEPIFSEGEVFDQMSEDETTEIFESDNDEDAEGENPIIANLSGMKLSELRALAKSRGLKGFSKMKKQQLIELLSGSSI